MYVHVWIYKYKFLVLTRHRCDKAYYKKMRLPWERKFKHGFNATDLFPVNGENCRSCRWIPEYTADDEIARIIVRYTSYRRAISRG